MNTGPQIQKKGAELTELASKADSLGKRYTAYLMLYDAACMAGQEDEIALRREECHTLLDAILDNTRAIHLTTHELQKLMHG